MQTSSPISALLRWRHFRLTHSLSLSLSLSSLSLSLYLSLSHRAHLTHSIGSASYNKLRLQVGMYLAHPIHLAIAVTGVWIQFEKRKSTRQLHGLTCCQNGFQKNQIFHNVFCSGGELDGKVNSEHVCSRWQRDDGFSLLCADVVFVKDKCVGICLAKLNTELFHAGKRRGKPPPLQMIIVVTWIWKKRTSC